MPALTRSVTAVTGVATALLAYGTVLERNAFVVRDVEVPVLSPGSAPLRVLHITDVHITPGQHRKQEWIRGLADLEPDLVINTGDTLSALDGVPAVLHALEPLFAFPGAFVPGNNDYFDPRPKNPVRYFFPDDVEPSGTPLPWPQLAHAMTAAGWLDLTNRRDSLDIGERRVALAGTDDPHSGRARYDLIAGPTDRDAIVRIGATHSPEPAVIADFAADRYDLVLAGHTHGGQVRVPFGPAIVTNCGIDRNRARGLHEWDGHLWFHVSAGVGTGPYSPIRLACRPDATMLTLVARGAGGRAAANQP